MSIGWKAPLKSPNMLVNRLSFVIKEKLKQLFQILQEEIGEINGRVFVDSAPVMDKAWAGRVVWGGWVKTPI